MLAHNNPAGENPAGLFFCTLYFFIFFRTFQISTATNLLPACKNLGVTHITNGAYRLHPIEWAIGEAQGALAAHMCRDSREAKDYIKDFKRLRKLQMELVEHGAPIYWFDDVATDHENFAAIQFVAATRIFQASVEELSFRPNEPITEEEACLAIGKILPNEKFKRSESNIQVSKAFLRDLCETGTRMVKNLPGDDTNLVTRSHFAQALYRIVAP